MIKIISVKENTKGFFQEDYTSFVLEYEEKKWWYLGSVKTRTKTINVLDVNVKSWLKRMNESIGVWMSNKK